MTKGFSIIEVAIALSIILAGVFLWIQLRPEAELVNQTECSKVLKSPIDISNIQYVTSPGSIIQGHFKTHSYINFKKPKANISSPFDGEVYDAVKYLQENKVQYTFMLRNDCNLLVMFDHISHPIEEIAEQLKGKPQEDTRSQGNFKPFDVKQGDSLGYTDGNGVQKQFDFGVYDLDITNDYTGTKYQDLVSQSEKYVYATCPFDYLEESQEYYGLISKGSPEYFCKLP